MDNRFPNKFSYLAFLSALSISFFVLDSFIPKPLPFLKIGMGNSIILYLIWTGKFKEAFIVAFSKVFLGSLLLGTILSPTFLFSLSGTFTAVLIMIVFKISDINFSIFGISIIGATAHNIMQLVIARLILIQDNSLFYFIPIMLLLAVLTGIFTGYIADYLKKIFKVTNYEKKEIY